MKIQPSFAIASASYSIEKAQESRKWEKNWKNVKTWRKMGKYWDFIVFTCSSLVFWIWWLFCSVAGRRGQKPSPDGSVFALCLACLFRRDKRSNEDKQILRVPGQSQANPVKKLLLLFFFVFRPYFFPVFLFLLSSSSPHTHSSSLPHPSASACQPGSGLWCLLATSQEQRC